MPDIFFMKSFPDPLVISELDSFRVKKYGNTPTVASKSEVGASTEPEPKITNQETVSYHVTRSWPIRDHRFANIHLPQPMTSPLWNVGQTNTCLVKTIGNFEHLIAQTSGVCASNCAFNIIKTRWRQKLIYRHHLLSKSAWNEIWKVNKSLF